MEISLFNVQPGAPLPDRIKLLSWGRNDSIQGLIIVGHVTAARLAIEQKSRGFGEVALDFEHNTVPGSPEYERSQEPRRVAAYGTPTVRAGEGLFLENMRWTPAGVEAARLYRDLSPSVALDDQREVTFVHSAALVRNGAVHGLHLTLNSAALPPRRGLDAVRAWSLKCVADVYRKDRRL